MRPAESQPKRRSGNLRAAGKGRLGTRACRGVAHGPILAGRWWRGILAGMDAAEKRRWYRPTPGWLVYGSLAVTGLLFLSERWRWFPFNEHKGWTVLIAVAVAIVFLVGTLLLWAVGHARGWRNRFRIWSALPMGLAVSIPFIWFSLEMGRAVRHRQLANAIGKSHGGVRYDYWFDKDGNFLQILSEVWPS